MVDFLVIGNGSAVTYNSVFPYIKDGVIRYGYSISSGYRMFEVPDDYEFYGTVCKEEEGKRYIAVSGVRWFTTMREVPPPQLVLSKKYSEGEYKRFEYYDAINVDRTEDIPGDYGEQMGVPVTFLDKYNSEQFEILDARDYTKYSWLKGKGTMLIIDSDSGLCDGKNKYCRILIKRK